MTTVMIFPKWWFWHQWIK